MIQNQMNPIARQGQLSFALLVFAFSLFLPCLLSGQVREWHPLPNPGYSHINYAALLDQDHGYIFTENRLLYRYEKGGWTNIALPAGIIAKNVFVAGPEDIWLTYQLPNEYREKLFHYCRGAWQPVASPNVDAFSAFYFESHDRGWAGTHWGEILRFENGKWRQHESPTRCHIVQFAADARGNLLARTDCQGNSQILHLAGETWQVLETPEMPEIRTIHAFSPDSLFLLFHNEPWLWDGEKLTPLPLPFPIYSVQYFPDGTGYAIGAKGLVFLNRFEWQVILSPESLALPMNIALSPDGNAWLYGTGLWATGPAADKTPESASYFDAEYRSFGQVQGAVYLTLDDSVGALYLVEHEVENLLIPLHPDGDGLLGDPLPASDFGLEEPQTNDEGSPIYDLAALAADFNNDGKEDLFLAALYKKVCLFFNLGDGKFKEVSKWAGFTKYRGRFGAAATADIDNDGDLDIFLPNEMGQSYLFVNNGLGKFQEAGARANAVVPYAAKAATFGDIDNDGRTDLAVTTYGEGTYLFRNIGNGIFQDISASSPALKPGTPQKSSSLAFADFDNDGDLDLFICKMLASNALLENDGRGRFRDITAQVGLLDSSLSRGATFFDFDNDGDLDLFLANMGLDALYENDAGQKFHDVSEMIRVGNSFWTGSENMAFLYGRNSNGAVSFDLQFDGRIDLFVGSFDFRSFLLKNHMQKHSFIGFQLRGAHSNRSAIGARVNLYRHAASDSLVFLGTRMIESSSGYGSHSQKLIHFGADTGNAYLAEIIFAGGDTIVLPEARPGRYYTIEESASRPRLLAAAKKTMVIIFAGFRAHLLWTEFLIFALILAAMLWRFRKRIWWNDSAPFLITGSAVAGLVVPPQVFTFRSDAEFLFVPLSVSFFAAAIMALLIRQWYRSHSRRASLEALSLTLAGFSHSAANSNHIASLPLHLSNLPPETAIDDELLMRCRNMIRITRNTIEPEIRLIIEYLNALQFSPGIAVALSRTWRRFRRNLRILEMRLKQRRTPKMAVIAQANEDLRLLKDHLRDLRKAISKYQSCDVLRVIHEAEREFTQNGLSAEIDYRGELPQAHISAPELYNLISELFANANRAMQNAARKQVRIRVFYDNRIHIRFSDTGSGIPKRQWEAIFSRNHSTRQGGGLGLYYARKMLERFNGSIRILDSRENTGTTFEICLEKAE